MAEIPSGSVIITPDDMWRTIQDTAESSRRTEAAVNELKLLVNPALHEVRSDVATLDTREQNNHEKHEGRIRALEEQSWASRWVPALVTAVLCSVIAGVIVFVIVNLNK